MGGHEIPRMAMVMRREAAATDPGSLTSLRSVAHGFAVRVLPRANDGSVGP